MKIPYTYSEWVACFDIVKQANNDEAILICIQQGKIELSAGMVGRFAEQLSTTIQARMKIATDRFSRAVQLNGTDYNVTINSLLMLRKEFKYLLKLAQIQGLPADTQTMLADAIKQQANEIQQTLEKNSKSDRTGVLGSIVRKNRVNYLED